MTDKPPAKLSLQQQSYWRGNVRGISVLLSVWFALSFGLFYFAREMTFNFFGWHFSFWLGAQGAPLSYCLIVAVYAWWINRIDIEYGVDEGQDWCPRQTRSIGLKVTLKRT